MPTSISGSPLVTLEAMPLMADDRLDDHKIPLTHEFLGVMLGLSVQA
jgi:hypothetical protein